MRSGGEVRRARLLETDRLEKGRELSDGQKGSEGDRNSSQDDAGMEIKRSEARERVIY